MTTAVTHARVRRALALVALAASLVPAADGLPTPVTWTVTGGTADLDAARGPGLVATGGTLTATRAHVTFAGELLVPAEPEGPASPPASDDDASTPPAGAGGSATGDDAPTPPADPGHEPVTDTVVPGVRLTQVQVHLDGEEGTLLADVTSDAASEPVALPGVEIGTIDLTGHPLTVTGAAASVSGAPVTLTADGAPVLGREPGDPLGSLDLAVSLAATAPAQPQDVVVHAGEDARFAVAVPGSPEPDVRWQTRPDARAGWQDLTEATGPVLTLPAVTVAQDGTQVRAVVGAPGAVSDAATLTVPAPAVQLLAEDGVSPLGEVGDGDTVVVRGTGFGPEANVGGAEGAVPGDLPQGTVVALGAFAGHWRPSEGAPAASRTSVTQVRALAGDVLEQLPAELQDAVREQSVELAVDGSFTATLVVTTPSGGWPRDGVLGVYTYPAGGATNPDQELGVPLSLALPSPEPPLLEPAPAERPDAAAEPSTGATRSEPRSDLPEWPAALRADASPAAEPTEPVAAEPPEAEPLTTSGESLSTLVMLVVVALLGAALVAGTRERG